MQRVRIYFFSPAPARIRARSSNRSRSRFVNPSAEAPEDPPPPIISACSANCFARPSLSASHTGSQSFHPPVPYARASPAAPKKPVKVNVANAATAAVPSRRVVPAPLCRSADATIARRRRLLFWFLRRTFVVARVVGVVVERVVGVIIECVECVSDVVVVARHNNVGAYINRMNTPSVLSGDDGIDHGSTGIYSIILFHCLLGVVVDVDVVSGRRRATMKN